MCQRSLGRLNQVPPGVEFKPQMMGTTPTIGRSPACPWCRREGIRVVSENELAIAFADGNPLSPGHTLIIPRRHDDDLFKLSPAEQAAVWALVADVRDLLLSERHPDGFNVGLNVGAAAGQTVSHAHVHVIPRYEGDVDDPRGGIRWIIPSKARYWKE